MIILGIETSCDDTACAVLEIKNNQAKILSNVVLSQTEIHASYGGVVPQLAAKSHAEAITKVIGESLDKANLSIKNIDLISVTKGPGLIITLLVGVGAAKTLSWVFQRPMVGINHLEGHIYSGELAAKGWMPLGKMKFPALCLLVSGGHTMLILMKKYLEYEVLGETRDDAVGEAFDKVARLLDLGYPGGALIEEMAKGADPKKFKLPRAMINTPDYDFSLSGLKTAVLYEIRSNKKILSSRKLRKDLCASFQMAAFEPLVYKFIKAGMQYKAKTLLLGGGVSANKMLQRLCLKEIKKQLPKSQFKIPRANFTSDNGSMVALAAYYHYKIKGVDKWQNIRAEADLEL